MRNSKPLSALLCGVFLVLVWGWTSPARALLAAHDCSFCHNFHGAISNAGLLRYSSSEVLCLSCHNLAINDTKAATVHNPLNLASNQPGYITCRECHNPHDNVGGNIKLVGYKYDPSTGRNLATPSLRVELSTSNPASPVYKAVTFKSPTDFNLGTGNGACEICHAVHAVGQDCSACHGHDSQFYSSAACSDCHTGAGGGALDVGPSSPHLKISVGGDNQSCIACHPYHADGVLVPNNAAVGIDYTADGRSGFRLGGTATTGSTEAEICWNCHADAGVSEWGTNTQSATGSSGYDYGRLDQPNWTTAIWSSANFGYKQGAIRSTHAANAGATTPGVDAVGSIRCSYCHDVHELARATGDGAVGKPYLRGTWKGNPYPEDGAPQTSSIYTPRHWGAVPRGSILNNESGGFQIDQNNSYPTAGGGAPTWNAASSTWNWPASLWTLDESAGLCVLCHGSNVDAINTFGNAADDWSGSNGHSNAAIGGSGSAAANIFRTSLRAPSGVDTQGAKPDMGYRNHGAAVGYGFRGTDGRAFDILNPTMDGQLESIVSRPYGGNHYQWGAQVNETTTEKNYHRFSCSKCHNPHASRLPRLMITNCLDTRHNTWDDPRAGINAVDQARTNNNGITLSATSAPDNWGRTWSNTTSAQNCHRLAGDNRSSPVPGYGSGWNKVTPW